MVTPAGTLRTAVLCAATAFLGPWGANAAQAQAALDPKEALAAYYLAVGAGDCDRARQLRPGYSQSACASVEGVSNLRSDLVFEGDSQAALRLNVTVRRGGGSSNFDGFVLLSKGVQGWTIVTESFSSARNVSDTQFLQKHFSSAELNGNRTPTTPEVDPQPPQQQVTVTPLIPLPNQQIGRPPTPQTSVVSQTSTETTADPKAGDPVQRFLDYYDAVSAGNCDLATQIRPGYSMASCTGITEVLQYVADPVHAERKFQVLEVKVALRRQKGDDPEHLADFRGFVTLEERGGAWYIAEFTSFENAPSLAVYLASSNVLAQPEPQVTNPVQTRPVRPLSTSAGTTSYWTQGGPLIYGSQRILDACWSASDLVGRPSEKATTKTGPGAYLPPPQRKVPNLMLPPLPAKYTRNIRRVNTTEKVIALTFDIGEQNNDLAGYDGEIIDYLRANNIKATMYFGGKWMATHPERALQLIADPLFEMGNHAWTHGNMRVLTGQEAVDQILFTQAQYEVLLEELAQRRCIQRNDLEAEMSRIPPAIPTFRYPYGTCSNETLRMVNDFGLPAVQWDVVSADPAKGQYAGAMVNEIMRNAKPGSIVIMHANGRGWHTGKALPSLIPKLRAKGYRFVTVSELLEMGEIVATDECYERRPGDNLHYDRIFGKGTGE